MDGGLPKSLHATNKHVSNLSRNIQEAVRRNIREAETFEVNSWTGDPQKVCISNRSQSHTQQQLSSSPHTGVTKSSFSTKLHTGRHPKSLRTAHIDKHVLELTTICHKKRSRDADRKSSGANETDYETLPPPDQNRADCSWQ